jgi:hypothetical protein
MKLTKSHIKQLIKEEIRNVLNEQMTGKEGQTIELPQAAPASSPESITERLAYVEGWIKAFMAGPAKKDPRLDPSFVRPKKGGEYQIRKGSEGSGFEQPGLQQPARELGKHLGLN